MARVQLLAALAIISSLVVLHCPSAYGFPQFWWTGYRGKAGASKTCFDHPVEGDLDTNPLLSVAEHAGPFPEDTIQFTLKGATGAVSTVCPGGTYNLTVSYDFRFTMLLTTSVGTLSYQGAAPDTTCPNRVALGESDNHRGLAFKFPAYSLAWKVPCTADLSKDAVAFVTLVSSGQDWLQNSLTVKKGASCTPCTTPTPAPASTTKTTSPAPKKNNKKPAPKKSTGRRFAQ